MAYNKKNFPINTFYNYTYYTVEGHYLGNNYMLINWFYLFCYKILVIHNNSIQIKQSHPLDPALNDLDVAVV